MKKFVAYIMTAVLLVGGLAACGGGAEAKTGFAVINSNTASHQKAPADGKDGVIELTTVAAAALVDKDGKVIKLQSDTLQSKFGYNAEGLITTTADTVFKTKRDLKEEYNMKGASGISKEWYEQAAAFDAYVVGKTAAEIRGIAVTEGVATDADLAAGVTMDITAMKEVAALAVESAVAMGAKASDTLGFGITASAEQTKDPTVVQYAHYVVVTMDKNNKITSSIVDATQQKATLEAGVVTTDLTAPIKSKLALGTDYNMKDASPIKKEWDEQAKAFAAWAKGKTLADISGMALAEGRPDVADLKSSVTVHVTGFQSAYAAAGSYAK